MRAIAFAHDLAIMVDLNKKESVKDSLNLHMQTIINWYVNSGLQIAREKTEILLLTRMRVPRSFNITLARKALITRLNT